jgi:hypothetical protein
MNENLNDKKNILRSNFSTPLLPQAIESFSTQGKKPSPWGYTPLEI